MTEFDTMLHRFPDRKFCLHDGFAGFRWGSPSNPKWISKQEAITILVEYNRLTCHNPVKELLKYDNLFSICFEGKAECLIETTGFRMLGFNEDSECLYGDAGLG
ncbi:MAG: hypothetical protein KBA61_09160 [Spirochaetes bacterium]|nr:hypothetical protein [Spirochaetota bacterium]